MKSRDCSSAILALCRGRVVHSLPFSSTTTSFHPQDTMATQVKKRKTLSLEQKAQIIAQAESGRKKAAIAEDFGIPASSLSTILGSKDSVRMALASGTSSKHKKVTRPLHEELDKAVHAWFVEARASNVPLSGSIVQQKALNYACLLGIDDFKASIGWLNRFKARHNIVGKVLCGESMSADVDGAAAWKASNMAGILSNFAPADIYNADETGLFYEMLPARTLDFKGQRCHGGKHSKKRITVLLCTNMDGSDKRPPLVIGKSAKPRCFKGTRSLPVQYKANNKSWMTRAIFTEWMMAFDRDMKRQGRKVCLLLDNCSAHHSDEVKLTNTELRFFPPNCTSVLQPLDQGVILSLKRAYRGRLIQRLLFNTETGRDTKVDLYVALQIMSAAWSTLGRSVIVNCFRHAGFAEGRPVHSAGLTPGVTDDDEEASPAPGIAAAWKTLGEIGTVPPNLELDEYIGADACVVVHEDVSDEQIIKAARNDKDSSDEEDDDVQEAPAAATAVQVMDAFDVIRNFVAVRDDDVAMGLLTECENRVTALLAVKRKQTKLTDFWH
ncbi:tigger transposable element-derived protein 6-like [Dermacentor albipictus]|uniref:tigger transposable element-derived protein 6-like n=1 Tax=Dermacentor albipictus TaxID=60249 RepID=UPI0031FE04BF